MPRGLRLGRGEVPPHRALPTCPQKSTVCCSLVLPQAYGMERHMHSNRGASVVPAPLPRHTYLHKPEAARVPCGQVPVRQLRPQSSGFRLLARGGQLELDLWTKYAHHKRKTLLEKRLGHALQVRVGCTLQHMVGLAVQGAVLACLQAASRMRRCAAPHQTLPQQPSHGVRM